MGTAFDEPMAMPTVMPTKTKINTNKSENEIKVRGDNVWCGNMIFPVDGVQQPISIAGSHKP